MSLNTALIVAIYTVLGLGVLVANHIYLSDSSAVSAVGLIILGAGAGFVHGNTTALARAGR